MERINAKTLPNIVQDLICSYTVSRWIHEPFRPLFKMVGIETELDESLRDADRRSTMIALEDASKLTKIENFKF